MAQLFSGASGSFFFWRMAHIFIDNRRPMPGLTTVVVLPVPPF